jgi:hypothetical protein
LANGRYRKSVASIQIAGRHLPLAQGQKKLYISFISHLFPCPAGQVLFQKSSVPFRRSAWLFQWLFGILVYPVAGFKAARQADRNERKKWHDISLNMMQFEKQKQSRKAEKQKSEKNTQYPEHKENSTWAARRPHQGQQHYS